MKFANWAKRVGVLTAAAMLSILCVPAEATTSVAADWPPQVSSVQYLAQRHVYHRAADGRLEHHWADPSMIWEREFIGGANITGTPSAARDSDVYARSTSGYLQHWWWTQSTGWGQHDMGDFAIAGIPFGTTDGYVYATGVDGYVYRWRWAGTSWQRSRESSASRRCHRRV